jgi:hypothetical protein
LLLEIRNIRNALFFSFIASLCWVIAEAARDISIAAASGGQTKILFAGVVFNLLICFILSLLNLLPAVITRSMIVQEPLEGMNATLVSLIHYATLYLLIGVPYNVFKGTFRLSSLPMILALVAYIAWAAVSYVAARAVLTTPPIMRDSSEMDIPLNDSEKCIAALGDFMTLMVTNLGERRQIEKLWTPVYAYLKDNRKIQMLVLNKGLRHDQIALNAVGSIAYQLLSEGDLHAAFGTLSPDGEYVRKVWWVTANELVRRSYNKPDDVTQGLASLDAAIVSANPKE